MPRARTEGDATPLIEGAEEPTIAEVSFGGDVYEVRSERSERVQCPLPFEVFECVRARVSLRSALRRPDARQRWISRVLSAHFS